VAALDDWDKGKTDLIKYASQSPSTGMGEQALSAVILSSKEKGDIKTLLTTGADLVREYPKSSKVEGTLNTMIDSSIRMVQFRLVADYLESFASRIPDHKNAKEFLLQAGHIRKGLGQYNLSSKDYQRLIAMKPKDASVLDEIVFAVAENSVKSGEPDVARQVLQDNRERLTDTGKIRADASIAVFYLEAGNAAAAETYLKRALKAYQLKGAHADQELLDDMAHMVYAATCLENKKYMELQLHGEIDNNIVAQKAKLLEKLEKGYQTVILYKSPTWALKACYQSSIINSEFARFLRESPLPHDLTPEQKDQYAQIIQQKSRAYQDKADQYIKTCIQQGHKWEICDPELAGYFNPSADSGEGLKKYSSFSGTTASAEIGGQCLLDQELKGFHEQLLKGKNDPQTLLGLCELYMQRRDYRHAILIAQKALDEKNDQGVSLKASLYNCLGVSHLYLSNDMLAKDAFLKAISVDANHIGARVNLAGLFKHYGHEEQASQLYQGLPALSDIEKSSDLIHPRAKELFHASKNISKN
jgi:hypothetical protein